MSILAHIRARAIWLASASVVNGPCQTMVLRHRPVPVGGADLDLVFRLEHEPHRRSPICYLAHTGSLPRVRKRYACRMRVLRFAAPFDLSAARHTAAQLPMATEVATDVAVCPPTNLEY